MTSSSSETDKLAFDVGLSSDDTGKNKNRSNFETSFSFYFLAKNRWTSKSQKTFIASAYAKLTFLDFLCSTMQPF